MPHLTSHVCTIWKRKPITEASTSHYPDSNRKVTIKWKLASEPVQSEGGTERKSEEKGRNLRSPTAGRRLSGKPTPACLTPYPHPRDDGLQNAGHFLRKRGKPPNQKFFTKDIPFLKADFGHQGISLYIRLESLNISLRKYFLSCFLVFSFLVAETTSRKEINDPGMGSSVQGKWAAVVWSVCRTSDRVPSDISYSVSWLSFTEFFFKTYVSLCKSVWAFSREDHHGICALPKVLGSSLSQFMSIEVWTAVMS